MTSIQPKKVTRGAVTLIRTEDVNAGFERAELHLSDLHWDSIYCDRQSLTNDLDRALEKDALIFVYGDMFDAMQGRFDARRSLNELRPEFRDDAYFDIVINEYKHFLAPYAKNIQILAHGNHESSIIKYNGISLLDRLAYALNTEYGGDITVGGYGGWVVYQYAINGSSTRTIRQKYFHGSGGEAPVTRGAIQTNRQAVFLPDADIVINGHNHHAYHIPLTRERVTDNGAHYFDLQHHIRIPGYKAAYGDGTKGWEVSRGGVPKPIGCCWITKRLSFEQRTASKSGFIEVKVDMDVRPPILVESVEGLYDGIEFPQE